MLRLIILLLVLTVSASHTTSGQSTTTCHAKLVPIIWMQHAGEYQALCHQAFNAARWQLDSSIKGKKDKRPRAIITDVDETVLDNSYFGAQLVKDGDSYSFELWKQWTDKAACTPIPGALSFLEYAHKKGVTIFYVSNRKTVEIPATVKNLNSLGFPDAKVSNLLFQEDDSSKELRRKSIAEKYNVIMLIGDNLNDFAEVFEGKPTDKRNAEVENNAMQWGKKFIVLPNPSYGDWENALYEYARNLSEEEKIQQLRELLKTK